LATPFSVLSAELVWFVRCFLRRTYVQPWVPGTNCDQPLARRIQFALCHSAWHVACTPSCPHDTLRHSLGDFFFFPPCFFSYRGRYLTCDSLLDIAGAFQLLFASDGLVAAVGPASFSFCSCLPPPPLSPSRFFGPPLNIRAFSTRVLIVLVSLSPSSFFFESFWLSLPHFFLGSPFRPLRAPSSCSLLERVLANASP